MKSILNVFIVREGSMFVDFVGYPYPPMYVTTNGHGFLLQSNATNQITSQRTSTVWSIHEHCTGLHELK